MSSALDPHEEFRRAELMELNKRINKWTTISKHIFEWTLAFIFVSVSLIIFEDFISPRVPLGVVVVLLVGSGLCRLETARLRLARARLIQKMGDKAE